MNWEELGAIAELIGGIGVVLSLIYVSRQIKINTQAVRSANATTTQSNFQQLARFLYEDREGCELILRAMNGTGDLSPHERLAAYAYFFDFMKTAELSYLNFLRGNLDEDFWNASLTFYKAYFTTPGFREYWSLRKLAFVPEFQAAMDTWLAERPKITRPHELVNEPNSGITSG